MMYVEPFKLAARRMRDDGQGDLFNSKGEIAATTIGGVAFYNLTPELYAYLRHHREIERERAEAGESSRADFEAKDRRFLALRELAIMELGEGALRVAVSRFDHRAYKLPPVVGQAKAGDFERADPISGEVMAELIEPAEPPPAPEPPRRLPVVSSEKVALAMALIRQLIDTTAGLYLHDPADGSPMAWGAEKEPATIRAILEAEAKIEAAALQGDLDALDEAARVYSARWRTLLGSWQVELDERRKMVAAGAGEIALQTMKSVIAGAAEEGGRDA